MDDVGKCPGFDEGMKGTKLSQRHKKKVLKVRTENNKGRSKKEKKNIGFREGRQGKRSQPVPNGKNKLHVPGGPQFKKRKDRKNSGDWGEHGTRRGLRSNNVGSTSDKVKEGVLNVANGDEGAQEKNPHFWAVDVNEIPAIRQATQSLFKTDPHPNLITP